MVFSDSHELANCAKIPAICRIRYADTNHTTGTGLLVANGVILTSKSALLPLLADTTKRTDSLVATFFEGTKKKPIDAAFRPETLCFHSVYPDYVDYCLIACCEDNLFNVVPVSLPLTLKEWAPVREGEIILVVQHLIPRTEDVVTNSGASVDCGEETTDDRTVEGKCGSEAPIYIQQQRFEEVLRCFKDLYYLKANGIEQTSGCPAFNEFGQLIGLQSQSYTDGEGVINRVLSIVPIIKHLFVNQQLYRFAKLQGKTLTFNAIWETWYTEKDLSCVGLILENFKQKDIVRQSFKKLTEMPLNLKSTAEFGIFEVILCNLCSFRDEEELVGMGLRALWKLSVGKESCAKNIIDNGGIEFVVALMHQYSHNSSILQYGVVILYNTVSILAGQTSQCRLSIDSDSRNFLITSDGETEFIVATANISKADTAYFSGPLGFEVMELVLESMKRFPEEMVLQKFSLELLSILLRCNDESGMRMLQENTIEHMCYLIKHQHQNLFLMEALMGCMGNLAEGKHFVDFVNASCHSAMQLVNPIISLTLEYLENRKILRAVSGVLWALGNNPVFRANILKNPHGYEVLFRSTSAFSDVVV
ncbi:unnamed protein product [Phytomonas sp. EM1]|nr:unnamed protein product [Phytomonas sp. EM1]|eukprot:CCW60008.1 unnamed protein product [Phytomonas sp. isolate EM1]